METKRSATWSGWKSLSKHLHPDQIGPQEANFLLHDLMQDRKGFRGEVWRFLCSPRGKDLVKVLFRDGRRQVNERDFHQAIAENASDGLRKWLEMIGSGPINPEAAALVPAELAPWNPSSPENLATQILYKDEWYAKNQVSAEEMYVDALIN